MADVYRIVERFRITDRGIIYIVDNVSSLGTETVLYDLCGNRFKLKGMEMICRPIKLQPLQNCGIMLERLDGMEVHGNLLMSEPNSINFLFCSDPLDKHKIDEAYAEEMEAASKRFACSLFSYEDLEQGKLSLQGSLLTGLAVYRGWMMKPDLYSTLYRKLMDKGVWLINSPDEYEKYHLLPNWYEDFQEETAFSVWTDGTEIEDVLAAACELEGAYIVKDYVKSRKHEWYDACFIRDIRNSEDFQRVAGNFIKRQGDGLVGGVVLRRFEELRRVGYHEKSGMPISEEYRVFLWAGKILTISGYWNGEIETSLSDDEMDWIGRLAARVTSNYVTMDIARKVDGSLMVIEMGDGQVSGLQGLGAEEFYERLSMIKDTYGTGLWSSEV